TAAPLTVSEEPISAVPLIWIPPAASAALMTLSPPSMVVIATAGAIVSTVKVSEGVPGLPEASVSLATTSSGPSRSGERRVGRGGPVASPPPGRAVAGQRRADLGGAADLDPARRFRRIDDVVATLNGRDRDRRRRSIQREAERGRAGVAEAVGLAGHDGVRPI